ncbi:hypothetical protein C8Q76DRAFT_793014 [Earliella scabrosa]|nr:hypothetical protein C8Q76DRAFT_793014 [Earliella scabrosa]
MSLARRLTTPMPDEVIPPPSFICKRLYMRDGGDGASLQEQMYMQNCGDVFSQMLAFIRSVCVAHGINLNLAYGRQDKAKLDKVKDEVLGTLGFLRHFEDGWPVTYYLKKELKIHHFQSSPIPPRCPAMQTRLRASGRMATRSTTKRGSRHGVGAAGGADPRTAPRPPALNANTYQSRSNRAYVSIAGKTPRRGTRRTENSQGTPGSVPRAPSLSATLVESATANTHMELTDSEPEPQPVSQPVSVSVPHPPPSDPILDILLSADLPRRDAERLTALFRSFGIADVAYLRVFARMSTRDAWLNELCQKGDLSEIQMRVVRELLERVAFVRGGSGWSGR